MLVLISGIGFDALIQGEKLLKQELNTLIYLFPGQGSDHRIYKHLEIPEGFDTIHISLPRPQKKERLETYALRCIEQIDTSRPYILMGISLGGMICTELSDTLKPLHTIIISSAKGKEELPGRYNIMKRVKINRLVPGSLTKAGARVLSVVVEPDRRTDAVFKTMLKDKEPYYLKWTVNMIINWQRESNAEHITHIHGDHDHTLPIKNINCDYIIEQGTHSMIITASDEVNRIISEILEEHGTALP